MSDLNPQAQVTLRNCEVDIFCSNPNCCASKRKPLNYDVVNTWDGRKELTSEQCQHCGMITKIFIVIEAEVVGKIPKYVPKKKKKGNPKCDMADCYLYSSNPGTVSSWNIKCQVCKDSKYYPGYGDDNYRKMETKQRLLHQFS